MKLWVGASKSGDKHPPISLVDIRCFSSGQSYIATNAASFARLFEFLKKILSCRIVFRLVSCTVRSFSPVLVADRSSFSSMNGNFSTPSDKKCFLCASISSSVEKRIVSRQII